jgi:predicted transcriptional regulator
MENTVTISLERFDELRTKEKFLQEQELKCIVLHEDSQQYYIWTTEDIFQKLNKKVEILIKRVHQLYNENEKLNEQIKELQFKKANWLRRMIHV